MGDTKQRLLTGALQTLRDKGIAGASARSIAGAVGVNQGLIFYHFGSVDQLIIEACRTSTAERIQPFRQRFAEVASLRELFAIGSELHDAEPAAANAAVLAQVLAGAQHSRAVAEAGRDALQLWIDEIEAALDRLLDHSPIEPAVDKAGLARGVAAAFIGVELYHGVDPAGATVALRAFEQLSVLSEVLDDLGPIGRRAVQARLRRLPDSQQ
ncbi:MAG TPA: TetR/AcrR family transcriptional regulator [Jatrophihabitans sp.]|nr:TetR/AcrR family transcriptional regulator [Jatrophihabitans sp.]